MDVQPLLSQSRDIECKLYPSNIPPYDVMGCYRFRDRTYVYIARGTQYPAVQVSVGYPASTWSMAPQWGSGYTLFPGQHWTTGTEFRCSAVSGYTGRMDCWSLRTGHGFLMSKFGLRKY